MIEYLDLSPTRGLSINRDIWSLLVRSKQVINRSQFDMIDVSQEQKPGSLITGTYLLGIISFFT